MKYLPDVEHRQHARAQQSSGKFAPTNATAREENAALQISPHTRNAFSPQIAPISGHFQPRRHRMRAQDYRATLQDRFQTWNEVTRVKLVS